ncbi:MAG: PHP domain-containing protein [Candidatus Omnitrophica bacterium]|nr:PHP domain-containing protein [Candidatus Omnitrophota bacterium]
MNFVNPFEVKGNWYKGNLHTHTTNSDGEATPEEVLEIYGKAGYNFLCITDHNKITEAKAPENMLFLRGSEKNSRNHIVGIELQEEFDGEGLTDQQIIDRMNLQNAIVIIAHPYWSGVTSGELLRLNGYLGIEVFNTVCNRLLGKGYSTVHFDEMLQTGRKIMGFASDDTHSRKDAAHSFIMAKADSCTKKDILASIKNGCFYSSTGVIIKNLEIAGSSIKVTCPPAEAIDFIAFNSSGKRFTAEKGEIEHAEYAVRGNEIYIRIEITGRNGKKAWTNPLFL